VGAFVLGAIIHGRSLTAVRTGGLRPRFLAALSGPVKPEPFHRWVGCLGFLLLCVLPAVGQVQFGDFHATATGELTAGYTGSYGNTQSSSHSTDFGGTGSATGYFYNPNFLSFSLLPFYGRSQDNSDSQSIGDSSGYTGTLNIFSGSHFPGYVGFNQQFNSTGTFGIPGEAGLKTDENGHSFNVGWSALLPGLPSLSVGFSDGTSNSSLYGSDSTSKSTNRSFDLSSGYQIAGFFLNGGYTHLSSDATVTGLSDGTAETTSGSSNLYRLNAVHAIPFYKSSLSMGFSRDSYHYNFAGNEESGTTDNANANMTIQFPRLPVAVYANYTDNLVGNFEQQLVNNGQAPLQTLATPASRSLSEGASTYYNLMPHTIVGGYVTHTSDYYDGQDYGFTQAGGTISFNELRRVKGLMFSVGMVDTATQQGNTRAGFIGNVEYRRLVGRWELESYFRYDQDVETLLTAYTTSVMTFGGSVKREFPHGLRWVAVGTGSRSVFEQQPGNSSRSESLTTMLLWKRIAASGNYEQSKGVAILTAQGLVPVPVPGQELPGSNLSTFNGKSYGGSLRFNPTRTLGFSASYSRSDSNSISALLPMNSASTSYYALATYRLRKLLFTAGYTNFRQSISTSGVPPSVVTSYYFGISRWFKAF
jgi:hypothetical protein